MLAARARQLVLTVWAGSLWTVGYLVAPVLFGTLADRALAGTIAGSTFRSVSWLSLGCGLAMLALLAVARDLEAARLRRLRIMAIALIGLTLINAAGLLPMIGEARAAGDRQMMGILHGVSMVVYLLQSVVAGALVWKHQAP